MLIVSISGANIRHNPQKATHFWMFNFFLHTSPLQCGKYALSLWEIHDIIQPSNYKKRKI